MPNMHLTTFLANDLADSPTKTSRLAKYLTPGGADYYWALKQGARRIFLKDEPFDQAVGVMANMSVDHQRAGNQTALKAVYEWKLANPGKAIPPPTGIVQGPEGVLTVKLEPAWAIERKGRREAYVPWTYKDLRLTRPVAGMGIYLLETALSGEGDNWDFFLIDLNAKKRFNRSCITKVTPVATRSALLIQESIFLGFKKSA